MRASQQQQQQPRPASAAAIDAALEHLYEEDVARKAAGAGAVWALARATAANLQPLAGHPTLLGALARSLRDDGRKSAELAASLLQTLSCFSLLGDFHAPLTAHRVGDACLRLLELEVKRAGARAADGARLERLAALQAQGDEAAEAAYRRQDAQAQQQQQPLVAGAAPGADATAGAPPSRQQGGLPRSAGGPRLADGAPAPVAAAGLTPQQLLAGAAAPPAGLLAVTSRPLPLGRVDLARERLRAGVLARRQDAVLAPCLRVLRHLADDTAVERKMCARGIVALLLALLRLHHQGGAGAGAAPSRAVALQALAFLRKLSVFEENKDAMAAQHIASLLAPLLLLPPPPPPPAALPPGGAPSAPAAAAGAPEDTAAAADAVELRCSVLRLAFNLCFDAGLCAALVRAGVVPRVAALLRQPAYRGAGLRLLYQLSRDARHRPEFAACDAAALVFKLVVAFPAERLPAELAGVAVNLALCATTAAAGVLERSSSSSGGGGGGPLQALVARAVRTRDPCVLRMLRGLAWHCFVMQCAAHDAAAAAEERAFTLAVRAARRRQRRAQRQAAAEAAVTAPAATAGSCSPPSPSSPRPPRRPSPPQGAAGCDEAAGGDAGGAAGAGRGADGAGGGGGGGAWDAGDDDDASSSGGAGSSRDEDDDPVDVGLMPDEPVAVAHDGGEGGSRYRYHAGLWAPHVREFARLAVTADDAGVLAEALATLACFTQADLAASGLAWGSYARDPAFLGALAAALSCPPLPRDADDDVLLGALQVLCAAACDPDAAEALAGGGGGGGGGVQLARTLADVLAGRPGDADVLLQACCAIGRLLHHGATRAALLTDDADGEELALTLVELVGHAHDAVAAEAAACMHLVLDELAARLGESAPLVARLRARRFALFNREWCHAVAAEQQAQQQARAAAAAVVARQQQQQQQPLQQQRPATSSGRRPGTACGATSGGAGESGLCPPQHRHQRCHSHRDGALVEVAAGEPTQSSSLLPLRAEAPATLTTAAPQGRGDRGGSGGGSHRAATVLQPPPGSTRGHSPPPTFSAAANGAGWAGFRRLGGGGPAAPHHLARWGGGGGEDNDESGLGSDDDGDDDDEAGAEVGEDEEAEEEARGSVGGGSSTSGGSGILMMGGRRDLTRLLRDFQAGAAPATGTLRRPPSSRAPGGAPATAAEAARFGLS